MPWNNPIIGIKNSVNKYYHRDFHVFIYFINDWIECHKQSYTSAPVALFCISKSIDVYPISDAYLDGALDHLHHDSRVLWDRETLPEKYKKTQIIEKLNKRENGKNRLKRLSQDN